MRYKYYYLIPFMMNYFPCEPFQNDLSTFWFSSPKNGLCLKWLFFYLEGSNERDLCIQTLKLIESNFMTSVSQVTVSGKFGQCLINLKNNFRASHMTIIMCSSCSSSFRSVCYPSLHQLRLSHNTSKKVLTETCR